MEPALILPGVEVYVGDAKATVLALAEKYRRRVNCVMTSPPYFGLRDYGTGRWEGGDPACPHNPPEWAGDPGDLPEMGKVHQLSANRAKRLKRTGGVCLNCGARWVDQQIGAEQTVEEYIDNLCDVFDAIGEHLLRPDGSLWINLGDSYSASHGGAMAYGANSKTRRGTQEVNWELKLAGRRTPGYPKKCLLLVPERFTLEMIRRGWILRNKVVWFKGLEPDAPGAPPSNAMPDSAPDRLKDCWEFVFHFTRRQRYYYDLDAIREPGTERTLDLFGSEKFDPRGRNPGDVWFIPTVPFPLAHYATYNPELVHRPVKATCPVAVCKACGAPMVPVRVHTGAQHRREPAHSPNHKPTKVDSSGRAPARVATGEYQPSCTCNAGWEGGVVLDPFGGSGATAQGASEARPPITVDGHFCQVKVILIDLDPRNVDIIERRLTGRAKPARRVDTSKYGGGLFELAQD